MRSELRGPFARCPAGRRLVTHGTAAYDVCENINECAEFSAAGVPLCRHGVCRDLEDGYVCHCDADYVGPDCSTHVEASSWTLSSSALIVVTSSITLLLGNSFLIQQQSYFRISEETGDRENRVGVEPSSLLV